MTNDIQTPLVSVIMAVYHGDSDKWLRCALDSVLRQTYTTIELIVVSDGLSNSALLDVILCLVATDDRVKLYRVPENRGLAYALNLAISKASGFLIVRMDADDISPSRRVACLVEFMLNNPDIDVAGSFISEFSDESDLGVKNIVKYPCTHDEMRAHFRLRNPLAHASAIFRRSYFDKAGCYSLFSIRNEDTFLWLNGFKANCRFANIAEVLYFVRTGSGNVDRRIGFRKSLSDFVDRIRVLIDLDGRFVDYLIAIGMLAIQNMPRSIYMVIRSSLIHSKNRATNGLNHHDKN